MSRFQHGKPAPLTRDQIRRMAEAREAGVTLQVIGQRFGVSMDAVRVYLEKERKKRSRDADAR